MASRPELFVRGDADDIKSNPEGWMVTAGQVLAHGRDPNFPPDLLGPSVFGRDGGQLASPGLFVDLGPWQFHLLAVQ